MYNYFLVLILYVYTQDNKDAANARILMRLAASSQFVTFWKINDFRYGVIEQIFEHMDGNEKALVYICIYILKVLEFFNNQHQLLESSIQQIHILTKKLLNLNVL